MSIRTAPLTSSLAHMKTLLLLCAVCNLAGCVALPKDPYESSPPMAEADKLVAFNFVRALYRPARSDYRIILDPNAEQSWAFVPLRTRRANLSSRLLRLRAAPKETVRIRMDADDGSPSTKPT